ncbi:ABC transporter ATP-binding protein [Facklamia miroungae]|uniref:Energy-coupling factor transport system ATP-binding protein n=1 Tax=Facklamia miroungae TaxID=120956 RepID=A0A1G7UAX0_9LACT|nr:ABC transporter ATP-binding protein [Facklamia miroungae]NKZ30039.1 ABC transporter ATP-binding protein [Facklamia miroungae]SDG44732.1 energy-coupling factor transport system ATP-binding protein [Facklamia miroungae]
MIEFKNSNFIYPNKNQIGPIDLTINEGEVHLLTGISGSGKTSIIRLVNGIIDNMFEGEKSGNILIKNKNVEEMTIKELVSLVSSVYQNPKSQFFTDNSTSELLFPLENIGYQIEKMEIILNNVMEVLDISHLLNRNVLELSGGEKQILCLASTMMINSDVIVLDEPTSNLDLKNILKVKEILKKLKSLNKTILISEHRLNYLNGIVDNVSIIKNGQIYKNYCAKDFYNLSEEERKLLYLRSLNEIKSIETCKKTQANNSEKYLEINDLHYEVKKKEILNIKNLKLYSGKIYFLIGKNGAGKSTFARNLVGLQKAKEDNIYWLGKKISSKQRLKKSYLVFQDVNSQLFTSSVCEEIELNNEFDKTNKLLEDLNLSNKKDHHPQSLSGGEKQRVSLAAGIASNRRIFIADEPTSGMDYSNMMNVCKLLRDYANQDNIVLIISHDLEFISELADEILFMSNGRIIRNQLKSQNLMNEVGSFLK